MCEHTECREAKELTTRILENIKKGIVEERDRQQLAEFFVASLRVLNNLPPGAFAAIASGMSMAVPTTGLGLLGAILAQGLGGAKEKKDPLVDDVQTWPGKGSEKGN